ncbi:hypothetical protein BZA77DRAFT_306411 [Pyronema omphalodes]|nr:hypothetical protein BZA77DRAFT_306411 [Pyronema omphalodes]
MSGVPICKFFEQGRCSYGNHCKYQHIQRHNTFGGPSQQQQQQSRDNYLPATVDAINADLTESMASSGTMWILSSYGPGKNPPCQLIDEKDVSFEEMRVMAYQAQAEGTLPAYEQHWNNLNSQAQMQIQSILSNLQGAINFLNQAQQNRESKYRYNTPGGEHQGPMPQFGQPLQQQQNNANPFGQPAAAPAQANPFGQPQSAFGQPTQPTSAFGQPSPFAAAASTTQQPTPAFGQPTFGQPSAPQSAFGQQSTGQSAFGQTSTLGAAPKSAFGQPAFGQTSTPQSAFGQTSTPQSAFGQSSFGAAVPKPAFGQPAFGQSTALGASQASPFSQSQQQTSAFGQPSALGGATSAFGQPSALGATTSAFGQPSALGGATSAFGQPSILGGAGPKPAFGQSGFGQSAFGQSSVIGQSQSPFAAAAAAQQQQPQAAVNPFGQPQQQPQTAVNPFGQPQQQSQTNAVNPFGQPQQQPQSAAVNPFGQPQQQPDNKASPFSQQNVFQNAQQSTAVNPFGQPAASAAAQPAPVNAFAQMGQQQQQQAPTSAFSQANPFQQGAAQQAPASPSAKKAGKWDDPEIQYTQQEIQAFQAPYFTLGMIPTVAPPRELCF